MLLETVQDRAVVTMER